MKNPAKVQPKSLEIKLFGEFEVALDGEPVLIRSAKAKAALSYIAFHFPNPIRRLKLATLLWSDMDESRGLANLRLALVELRELIGDYLESDRNEISLAHQGETNFGPQLVIDKIEFDSLIGIQASEELDLGTASQCIELYRGPLLDGLELRGALGFEEFVSQERTRVARLVSGVMGRLIDSYRDSCCWELANHLAYRLWELDTWDESRLRKLIEVLSDSGDSRQALTEYRIYRDRLEIEMGATPQRETLDLAEKIATGLQDEHQDVPTLVFKPANQLFGRQDELSKIIGLLTSDNVRLVSLTGPGGVGKTRLAQEVAYRLANELEMSAAFIALSDLEQAHLLASNISLSLGLALVGLRSPIDELCSCLGDREILLVLDNLEQLLPDAALAISELINRCPMLRILVTSRNRVNLRAETVVTLERFVPPRNEADDRELRENPAIQLFCSRAVAWGANEGLDDLESIAQICTLLEGLPLSIELAAARCRLLPPSELLPSITCVLDDVSSSASDLPLRQRTLRASMDWSYQLLDSEAQKLLRSLGVFDGGAPLSALISVAELGERAGLDAALRLIESGLVERISSIGGTRLVVLDSVHAFARDELERCLEYHDASSHHAITMLKFAKVVDSKLRGPSQAEWILRATTELENLRAAFQFALATNNARLALELSTSLVWFWSLRGMLGEARECLEGAIKLAKTSADQESTLRLVGSALLGVAFMAIVQDEGARASEYIAEADIIYSVINDEVGRASVMFHKVFMGTAAGGSRNTIVGHEASNLLAEARDLFAKNEDYWSVARVEHLRSSVEVLGGDIESAKQSALGALEIFTMLGDRRGIAISQSQVGIAEGICGNLEEGSHYLLRALEFQRSIGDILQSHHSLLALACNLAGQSRGKIAAALFGAAESIARTSGVRAPVGYRDIIALYISQGKKSVSSQEWDEAYRSGFEAGISIEFDLSK